MKGMIIGIVKACLYIGTLIGVYWVLKGFKTPAQIDIIGVLAVGAIIWVFVEIKKKDKPVRLSNYLFAYRIRDGDAKALPVEFLVNWKISNLENHLYLLYLTLEEDLYIEGYLKDIWVDYEGLDNVYVEVYEVEGRISPYGSEEEAKHVLIGKFCVVEGKMCYTPV